MITKPCTKCGEIKPAHEFYVDKRNRNGLQSQCKACCILNAKSYEERHADKIKARRKIYYENNADERRALSRRIRNRNVELARERCKDWRRQNPHLVNAGSAKRRAIINRTTPSWANQEKIELQYFMARFLTEISGLSHEVDHIIPIRGRNVCGLHVETNLRVVLASENRSKSNKYAG